MDIASVDLEMTHLTADIGRLLCGSVKPLGGATKTIRCDDFSSWKKGHRSNDADLAYALLDEIRKYDVIITWNGIRFDVPFLDSRLVIAGETDSAHMLKGNIKHIDLMYQPKFKLRFTSNSLAHIARTLNTPNQKMEVPLSVWTDAIMDVGTTSRQALDVIVERNISDVLVLEDVYMRLKHLVRVVKG